MTRVAVLTPPGAGAIATVEVSGPGAWPLAKQLFRPAGKPLPESPVLHRFWFGTLGGDEVILAVTGPESVEVHCHGGVRVVRWVVEQFVAEGCAETPPLAPPPGGEGRKAPLPPRGRGGGGWGQGDAFELLQRAPTLRTAAILLDQLHGAFDRETGRILDLLESPVGQSPTYEEAGTRLRDLARWASVGRHLVEPWKVVVAGAPNVGKSSLVNALAGYQRAVVSEVPGTTRDLVSVQLAFDGWPVELTDTAGLREAEGLEAKGVERATRALAAADLVLWVIDGSDSDPRWPADEELAGRSVLFVANKSDLPARGGSPERDAVRVSAATGAGVPDLVGAIVRRLVPDPPPPGVAVPYTPELAELVTHSWQALEAGRRDDAARLLRRCLGRPG